MKQTESTRFKERTIRLFEETHPDDFDLCCHGDGSLDNIFQENSLTRAN
jgi:hypothetical protein